MEKKVRLCFMYAKSSSTGRDGVVALLGNTPIVYSLLRENEVPL